jgi:hypothetical protein
MADNSFPNITSFMIRFTQESSSETTGQPVYRGFIRHIQTDKEIVFTHWGDAMAFIEQFVPIEGISRSANSNELSDVSETGDTADQNVPEN